MTEYLRTIATILVLVVPMVAFAQERTRFDIEAGLSEGSYRLTADRAAELALESAPQIDQARAAIAAAEAGEMESWIPMVPRLDLSARYMRIGGFEDGAISMGLTDMPQEEAMVAAEAVQDPAARILLTELVSALGGGMEVSFEVPRNQLGMRASLTMPLSDLFATLLPAHRAARAQTELEQHRLDAAAAEVELRAREAFYSYARARGAQVVARASLTLAEEHQRRMETMVHAELASESDLLQAQAHLAAARSGVVRTTAAVAVSESLLLTLIDVDVRGGIAISEPVTTMISPPPVLDESSLAEACYGRPEARALAQMLEVQDHMERAALGGFWPHFAFLAGADYANPNQRVIPPEDEFIPSWEVGAVVRWSPTDALRASARSRRVRAVRDQVEAELTNLCNGVELQAVRAREDQLAGQAVMEAAQERVTAAEESYLSLVAELAAGEAMASQLIDADVEVTRARLEVLQAGVRMRIARVQLHHALGR